MGMHLERIQDWETLARKAGHRPAALARLVGVSVRQLQRVFREQRACTPREWLVQSRLRHAAELLRQGKSDKEVAAAVGFQTASSLCHFFQQTTGGTPQEYLVAGPIRSEWTSRWSPHTSTKSTRALNHFEL